VDVITRLRLDAALYEPAPPRQPKQNGRVRKKGKRLPTLEQVLTDASRRWYADVCGVNVIFPRRILEPMLLKFHARSLSASQMPCAMPHDWTKSS
jgi:hypothetical protein